MVYLEGPVSSDMLIREVMQRYPGTLPVFQRLGLPCPRCLASGYENIQQMSVMLGVDLLAVLQALNEAVLQLYPWVASGTYGREPSPN